MYRYFEINDRGCNIRCKVYYQERCAAEKAVVFCTGFAGHKDNNAAGKFAEKVLSGHRDVIVVVFNWPAHGDDVKKKLTLEDCTAYLELVTEKVRSEFGARQLFCYATSFGGYLVLKYISEHGCPFEKIVLRCPAVNMYNVLVKAIMRGDEYDRIMKGKDVQVGFDRKILVTRALLDALAENDITKRDYLEYADTVLILHGTADEVVPFEDARAFAEENLMEFIPVEGADHRFQNPAHMSRANRTAAEFFGI